MVRLKNKEVEGSHIIIVLLVLILIVGGLIAVKLYKPKIIKFPTSENEENIQGIIEDTLEDCIPKICSNLELICGTFDDGCGNYLSCNCDSGYICSNNKCMVEEIYDINFIDATCLKGGPAGMPSDPRLDLTFQVYKNEKLTKDFSYNNFNLYIEEEKMEIWESLRSIMAINKEKEGQKYVMDVVAFHDECIEGNYLSVKLELIRDNEILDSRYKKFLIT